MIYRDRVSPRDVAYICIFTLRKSIAYIIYAKEKRIKLDSTNHRLSTNVSSVLYSLFNSSGKKEPGWLRREDENESYIRNLYHRPLPHSCINVNTFVNDVRCVSGAKPHSRSYARPKKMYVQSPVNVLI